MNVHLTHELEKLVHSKVETGRYNSASEVIREALRLMEEHDQLKALQRDEFRKQIAAGLESQRLGRMVDGDDVFAELEAELSDAENGSRK